MIEDFIASNWNFIVLVLLVIIVYVITLPYRGKFYRYNRLVNARKIRDEINICNNEGRMVRLLKDYENVIDVDAIFEKDIVVYVQIKFVDGYIFKSSMADPINAIREINRKAYMKVIDNIRSYKS